MGSVGPAAARGVAVGLSASLRALAVKAGGVGSRLPVTYEDLVVFARDVTSAVDAAAGDAAADVRTMSRR